MGFHPMLGTLVLLCACGGRYPVSLTASPASSPAEALECARAKLRSLGYRQTSYDESTLRITAQKVDDKTTRADPQFWRNLNRLEVQTAAEANGQSSLTIVGHTFAEFQTHRGPTQEEEPASTEVRESAQAILGACGSS